MKKIFELYLLALKKSFTIRGRASRAEFFAFHIIGFVPIFFCLIFTFPAIRSMGQQGEQLLASVTGNANHILPKTITPETFHEIGDLLFNDSVVGVCRQNLNNISTIFYQNLPALLLLILSTFAYATTSFSVAIRRLHDTGCSGFFYLTQFIPVVGMVIFLILMFKKGNESQNIYDLPLKF
jgi:uncharacterized membrane protein YhaH (DUF805 family)